MSLWERQHEKYRGSLQQGQFDRQDWLIYAVVVALVLVAATTYLLPR